MEQQYNTVTKQFQEYTGNIEHANSECERLEKQIEVWQYKLIEANSNFDEQMDSLSEYQRRLT